MMMIIDTYGHRNDKIMRQRTFNDGLIRILNISISRLSKILRHKYKLDVALKSYDKDTILVFVSLIVL